MTLSGLYQIKEENMVEKNLILENVRIGFRNFRGEEGKFNRKGNRNFCVFLDEKKGQELEDAGWNIRWLEPRREGDDRTGCLQVSVAFNNYPPKVVMVTSKGQTTLDEEAVATLDNAELDNVDLIVRPYNWEVNGKSGTKAYLKSGYFTIMEDELFKKYNGDQEEDDDLPF